MVVVPPVSSNRAFLAPIVTEQAPHSPMSLQGLAVNFTALLGHDVIDRASASFVGLNNDCRCVGMHSCADGLHEVSVDQTHNGIGAKSGHSPKGGSDRCARRAAYQPD